MPSVLHLVASRVATSNAHFTQILVHLVSSGLSAQRYEQSAEVNLETC